VTALVPVALFVLVARGVLASAQPVVLPSENLLVVDYHVNPPHQVYCCQVAHLAATHYPLPYPTVYRYLIMQGKEWYIYCVITSGDSSLRWNDKLRVCGDTLDLRTRSEPALELHRGSRAGSPRDGPCAL